MFLVKNNKSPYYQVVYYRNGKRTTVSTCTANKKEAEKFLYLFDPELREEKPSTKTSIKLSDFITEYKSYVRNSYSIVYLKKGVTPSFNRLQAFFPDVLLSQISSKDIDQFISSIYPKAKYAAALYYRTLKAAFNKAVVWSYLDENPFDKIKPPKISKSFPVYISEIELIQILNQTNDQLLRDMIVVAFYTGMRLGELINMKWDWIDLKEKIIVVKNTSDFKTKNDRERIIPIHCKVNQILKGRAINMKEIKNDFVFYRHIGIKLNKDSISKKFKKAVRSSGLNEKNHFHSLRHSFASALVKQGVSLYIVKELLGHSKITTTQIYSHIDNGSLAKAIKKLVS